MDIYFNKNIVIKNPLRILFLCGSHFNEKEVIVKLNGSNFKVKDKRKILKEFIADVSATQHIKTIILEENFMFNEKGKRLRYNDIDLKSLKSIELLTSFLSDYVLILHESYSTAAEIGIFSSSSILNNKLIVFSPIDYSTDENYISGFMNLAYIGQYFPDHNIEVNFYHPALYDYNVSTNLKKAHSFFAHNQLPQSLSIRVEELMSGFESDRYKFFMKDHNPKIKPEKSYHYANYRFVDSKKKYCIYFESKTLMAYILAVFNLDSVKEEFRKPRDIDQLNDTSKEKIYLINQKRNYLLKVLKKAVFHTLKTEIPSLTATEERNIEFEILNNDGHITFEKSVAYVLYIFIALGFIYFQEENSRFALSNEFINISREYEQMIVYSGTKKFPF
ncbi:hypothetical protein LPB41_11320 [Thalassospira sp. MA62]|nr:hypothetical protein [Thalassospira sp. MA62]